MLNFLTFIDPITPVLDNKTAGLAFVAVALFIGTSIVQYIIKDKLANLLQECKDAIKEGKVNRDELLDAVDKATEAIVELNRNLEQLAKEEHEQWGKINDLHKLVNENNIRLHDVADSVDTVAHQQTSIAAGQIGQNQNMQRVIEGLLQALSEHVRD